MSTSFHKVIFSAKKTNFYGSFIRLAAGYTYQVHRAPHRTAPHTLRTPPRVPKGRETKRNKTKPRIHTHTHTHRHTHTALANAVAHVQEPSDYPRPDEFYSPCPKNVYPDEKFLAPPDKKMLSITRVAFCPALVLDSALGPAACGFRGVWGGGILISCKLYLSFFLLPNVRPIEMFGYLKRRAEPADKSCETCPSFRVWFCRVPFPPQAPEISHEKIRSVDPSVARLGRAGRVVCLRACLCTHASDCVHM